MDLEPKDLISQDDMSHWADITSGAKFQNQNFIHLSTAPWAGVQLQEYLSSPKVDCCDSCGRNHHLEYIIFGNNKEVKSRWCKKCIKRWNVERELEIIAYTTFNKIIEHKPYMHDYLTIDCAKIILKYLKERDELTVIEVSPWLQSTYGPDLSRVQYEENIVQIKK